MSEWRFSDGTIVRLGGEVEGASLFAQELRESLGEVTELEFGPCPSPLIPFDKWNPDHMAHYLTGQLAQPGRRFLKIISAPMVEPLAIPAAEAQLDQFGRPLVH